MKMPDPSELPQAAVPVDLATLWRALCDDGSLYVWVVNEDGVVRYVNENGARFYLGRPACEVIGARLGALFPETFTRARLRLMRTALEQSTALRFPTHWAGQWLHATVRPIESPERGVLVLVRHAFQQCVEPDVPMLELWEQDEQPLGRLSATERLVLAGIGEGWPTQEIARRMHRSVKTVEWHRGSLGRRLGCGNRVELARVALLAGLSWKQAVASSAVAEVLEEEE